MARARPVLTNWSIVQRISKAIARERERTLLNGTDPHGATCVFVSHSRQNRDEALRVAWLAQQEGCYYWLDFLRYAARRFVINSADCRHHRNRVAQLYKCDRAHNTREFQVALDTFMTEYACHNKNGTLQHAYEQNHWKHQRQRHRRRGRYERDLHRRGTARRRRRERSIRRTSLLCTCKLPGQDT